MRAFDYIKFLEYARRELVELYDGVEPMSSTVDGVSCFVHPDDVEVDDFELLKHDYREI